MFVIIRDMSAGNECVGEMWQETKIFEDNATLEDVMKWGMGTVEYNTLKALGGVNRKRITITVPHQDKKSVIK